MMNHRTARTAGFSVMEAIIVLAITSLALTLVFTIGSRASEMGFRLGRRALGVADSQIASDSFRAIIGGIELPPFDIPKSVSDSENVSFSGDAHQLSGRLIAARATPCSQIGPVGHVTLSIRFAGGHALLQCNLTNRPAVLVADLGTGPAEFSYSTDGSNFADQVSVVAGIPVTGDPGPQAQYRKVYVRLANVDGSIQMIAIADTGRPINWNIFDPKSVF
jgi:hypothetical protein